MLRALARLHDQPAARHANKMLLQEVDKHARRVIRLYGSGKLTHAVDPFSEWNYVGAWDIERVGEHGDHLTPRLTHRVLDVVNRVSLDVGDK